MIPSARLLLVFPALNEVVVNVFTPWAKKQMGISLCKYCLAELELQCALSALCRWRQSDFLRYGDKVSLSLLGYAEAAGKNL